MKFSSWMASWLIGLLMFTATSYASEVAWLSIDNGNYTLDLPYLELVMPNDAYTAVLTSSDGVNYVVDYSSVRQLPLNHNVDKNKLVQLSIGVDGWFLELPYLEEPLLFGTKIHSATFHSYTGEMFVKIEGFCPILQPTHCPALNNLTPPDENLIPWLGASVDSDRNWLKQMECVTGEIIPLGNSSSDLSAKLGGEIFVEMNFKFKTTQQKKEFSGGGFGFEQKIFSIDLEASISHLSQTTKKESSLEIIAHQEGAQVEYLADIFGINGNSTSCSLDDLEPCKKAVDDIVAYIQDGFAETLREHPSISNYKYSGFDYVMGAPTDLASDVTSEIEQARENLATEYEKRLIDLDKVRNLLQYRLSSESKYTSRWA